MSLQAGKETIYKQDFQTSLEKSVQPGWLKALREKGFGYFTANGFPTVENEEWKYTNVAPMAKESFLLAEMSANVADELETRELEIETENVSAVDAVSSYAEFIFEESKDSVLIFANGQFDKKASKLGAAGGAEILSFSEALKDEKYAEILQARLGNLVDVEKNAFTALNTAFIGEGVFIHLPKNVKIDAPIQILLTTDDGKVRFRVF